jgi:hypothetical protein
MIMSQQSLSRVARVARVALFASLAVTPLGAQQKIEIRRAASPEISMRLSGSFASLRIVGWARDSLVIVGTIPKGARFDGGLGPAGAPARSGKYFVEEPGSGEPSGTLEIYLPERARLWSKAGTATISAAGITGGLDLNIVGGSITVTGNPRELNIESMDGKVEITGSPSWMRVKTATGDITMRGSAEDAAFTTISGITSISDGAFERVRVESVTGPSRFAADVARSGVLTMESHSGTLEIVPNLKSGLEIEANTITGKIENGISKTRPIPGREGRGEELAVRIGNGDARATLRSFKGTIRLAFR